MANLRTFDALVQRHVLRWEAETRTGDNLRPPRCLTISRLPGSGGAELGHRVAERLDYEFFGKEILDQIAKEGGVERRLLEGLDEHVRNRIDRYVVDAFRHERFTEEQFLTHVVRTVGAIGERGRAVLLGRGAPFILGPEKALRVLVVSPDPLRIERLMKQYDVSHAQAQARMAVTDEDRLEFLRQFREQPDDPSHFELVVNTGTLGMDAAVDVVVGALRQPDAVAAAPVPSKS